MGMAYVAMAYIAVAVEDDRVESYPKTCIVMAYIVMVYVDDMVVAGDRVEVELPLVVPRLHGAAGPPLGLAAFGALGVTPRPPLGFAPSCRAAARLV